MYESFYGLDRRPFSATPSAGSFVTTPGAAAALEALQDCLVSGQGVAMVTAATGLGKTAVCRKLLSMLESRFATAYLGHSDFSSRRALLQSILFEMDHPYSRMGDQELRLELQAALREATAHTEGLVLVIDEGHQLNARLLEEIRILSDFAQDGAPLVRVLLSGQLRLEEILAESTNAALNQRIACHVTLEPLTRSESGEYLASRIERAGASVAEMLSPAAIQLIAHVSDGSPRCLNQLADHSLLLGYVAEQKPIGESIVRDALEDLKQLPLHWNDPPSSAWERVAPEPEPAAVELQGSGESELTETENSALAATPVAPLLEIETVDRGAAEAAEPPASGAVSVIEVGEPMEDTESEPAMPEAIDEESGGIADDVPEGAQRETGAAGCVAPEPVASIDCDSTLATDEAIAAEPHQRPGGPFVVEPVEDRYAALDAAAGGADVSGFVWDLPVNEAPGRAADAVEQVEHDVSAGAACPKVEQLVPTDERPGVEVPPLAEPQPQNEATVNAPLRGVERGAEVEVGSEEPVAESGGEDDIVELVLDAQRAINARVQRGGEPVVEEAAGRRTVRRDLAFDVVMPEPESGIAKPPHSGEAFGRRTDVSERRYSQLFGSSNVAGNSRSVEL